MDFESLSIFCAVAAELSIVRAAARLGRAPSNVTTRIQQLEADIGAELFVRTSRKFALSTAGERFLDYAQRLLALADEARHVVTGGADGGVLRLGSMESTAASRLPGLLAGYHSRFPATRLDLVMGPSRQLMEQVRIGKLDCAFVALPPASGDEASLEAMGLASDPIWDEELLLLAPASEDSAVDVQSIGTRSLAAFPHGCTYRGIAEDLLGLPDAAGWRVQELPSYHAMIACVAAGACVALLPKAVLDLSNAGRGVRTFPAGRSETRLLWRAGYDAPAFRHFRDEVDRVRP
jgi:DNA-binding transcriptional LysR family regulator